MVGFKYDFKYSCRVSSGSRFPKAFIIRLWNSMQSIMNDMTVIFKEAQAI